MEDNLFKQIAIPISNVLNKIKRDESLWNTLCNVLAQDETDNVLTSVNFHR